MISRTMTCRLRRRCLAKRTRRSSGRGSSGRSGSGGGTASSPRAAQCSSSLASASRGRDRVLFVGSEDTRSTPEITKLMRSQRKGSHVWGHVLDADLFELLCIRVKGAKVPATLLLREPAHCIVDIFVLHVVTCSCMDTRSCFAMSCKCSASISGVAVTNSRVNG